MVELKQKMDLRMDLEKRHIHRVKDELQKNSNAELNKLKLLKKKHMVGLPAEQGCIIIASTQAGQDHF